VLAATRKLIIWFCIARVERHVEPEIFLHDRYGLSNIIFPPDVATQTKMAKTFSLS